MRRLDRTAREVLSHWAPWMIVAYIGLVGVVVYGYTLNARTLRDEAIRESEAKAAQQSAVARCLDSRPQLMRISRHVAGVNELALTLVENSAALLKQTPKTDASYQTRLRNLHRLIYAREKVKAIKSFPVPSVRDCKTRGGG